MLYMLKEAAFCHKGKIIDRPDSLDAAHINGIVFPLFRGGLLGSADNRGSKTLMDELDAYARK